MINRYTALALSISLVTGLALSGCQALNTSSSTGQAAVSPDQVTIIKSPNDDRQYQALLLSNQLQVVLVSDPSLENSAASLAVGVGSAQDPQDHQGLAHYLEHMLFLGTSKYPEPDGFMKFTSENGGYTNAFTAFDKTNFMFQVNSGKFDEALDRFSDYFKSPTFDPQFSDKERHAVNNEWSMQKAQDNWNLFALDGITGNPKNPQAKFNIGNLDTLVDKPNSVLQEQLKDFYNRYYSANIMRLTLVGKQSLPELKAMAEKYFAAIPNKAIERPQITVPGLTKAQYGMSIHYNPIKDLKVLFVDYPVQSLKPEWRYKPGEFVHNLITSEEPGTLCEQLRAKGLVKLVSASFNDDTYGKDGYFRVQAELTDMGLAHQDEIVAAIFAYVDMVKAQGLKPAYFDELKTMRSKDFVNAAKPDALNQAVELSMKQFDLPVAHLLDADYVYEKYDAKKIRSLLNELDEKHARIWYVNDNEKVETPIPYFDGKYSERAITAEEYAHWNQLAKGMSFNLPPLNDLFTDKPAPIVDNTYLKPHQVVSQAGVEAWLVQPEFYREDKGKLSLEINADIQNRDARQTVLASLVNDIFNKQLTSLSDRASRASLGVQVGLLGAGDQGIFISGYTTKHALLLDQVLKAFVDLHITDASVQQALDSYQQALDNFRKAQVYRQLGGRFGKLLRSPYWSDEQLLAASQQLTTADVIAYHQQLLSNPLLRIFAAGNYTEQQLKDFAQGAVALIPGKRLPEQRILQSYNIPAAGKPLVVNEDTELADDGLLQGFFRPAPSDAEQAQLSVLNALYGNAFFMQLRTHEQLGYAVFSQDTAVNEIPGFIMLVQSSNTDLPAIKARMDKFRKDYLAILKTVSDVDVEQTKQALIANLLQKPTDFYQEAGLYDDQFWDGKYSFDKRERKVAALKNVTKADLISIYQKLLLSDKDNGAMLLQLRGSNFKTKPFAK